MSERMHAKQFGKSMERNNCGGTISVNSGHSIRPTHTVANGLSKATRNLQANNKNANQQRYANSNGGGGGGGNGNGNGNTPGLHHYFRHYTGSQGSSSSLSNVASDVAAAASSSTGASASTSASSYFTFGHHHHQHGHHRQRSAASYTHRSIPISVNSGSSFKFNNAHNSHHQHQHQHQHQPQQQLQQRHNQLLQQSQQSSGYSSLNSSLGNLSTVSVGDDLTDAVTLQISNFDTTLDETSLKMFLLAQLNPITPVLSITFERSSVAKVKVPSLQFAKAVVANLHRRRVFHKRVLVSYARDSSSIELSRLRCQVAGLLKDVPNHTLPLYKFREFFQSRFKTSTCVMDLYKLHDMCTIDIDANNEKHISLHTDFIRSIQEKSFNESLQDSFPYCTKHFQYEPNKGWAELELDALPDVFMTLGQVQAIIYPLLTRHDGDIPIMTLLHCIDGELGARLAINEHGVNLEHLVCCVDGIRIITNSFGIKILAWSDGLSTSLSSMSLSSSTIAGNGNGLLTAMSDTSANENNRIASGMQTAKMNLKESNNNNNNNNNSNNKSTNSGSLHVISREVIELIKLTPKATLKFNKFIPAYHNYFGKQCRVADYGYTRLIELFDALSSVVQIMGDGENRLVTLTHRTQIRRFTNDLFRILRVQPNKSILLSQLPHAYAKIQNRPFEITNYGVCDIVDILDGVVNNNAVIVQKAFNGSADIVVSLPKRRFTAGEIKKICIFAGEVVEMLRNAAQYSILFQKFVRSYHYHFGYQCRLADFGYFKLVDLMEAISGTVELDATNDEVRKIYLSPKIAQRVFVEQLEELVEMFAGTKSALIKMADILNYHKHKYGYQITSQTLGYCDINEAITNLSYIEIITDNGVHWLRILLSDRDFREKCYFACRIIVQSNQESMLYETFMHLFDLKYPNVLHKELIAAMRHAIEFKIYNGKTTTITLTPLMKFILNIVRLLETRNNAVNLCELKTSLNLSITSCFEFGYANVSSLMQSFPEIFAVANSGEPPSKKIHERSDVCLVSNHPFSLNYGCHVKKYVDMLQANQRTSGPSVDKQLKINAGHQSLDEYAAFPLTSSSTFDADNNNNNNNNNNNTVKPLNSISNCFIANHLCQHEQPTKSPKKLKINDSVADTGHVTATVVDASAPLYNGRRLFERRSNLPAPPPPSINIPSKKETNLMLSASYHRILASLYEPPKPDTPPSKILPIWLDPVWGNQTGEKSPIIDSLNIQLPELKTFNIFPPLMSPCGFTVLLGDRQTFSFDSEN